MDISAPTWITLSKLLDEAFDLDSAARAGWLRRQAASQPELATVLRQLLAAHASSETADVLARLPTLALPIEASEPHAGLAAGDRVGPYRLKRELGSGGMADVWLAERADGAFVRDVALKLPHINRLRRDLAARFARERDILARLEHPHIARLYDAGVAGDGLPYLAMEYVDGQEISAWCDARKLDIAARLRLFAQVLDAVQYAHANLVIHRDLKPSNILVTADGQVRLLDFGIAKLLTDDERAHETQLTQLAGRALTPDYASPEQIKGEPLTIASDVYSLGVVLYELLTGKRPYKLKLQSAAQLEFAILEAESAPPSTNIAEAAPPTRLATPRQLARLLAGDLDTIALKALAKAPSDRYGTIAAFADDLQRHREGRTVTAIAPSRGYRLRKFVIRNKLGVGAGAAVAAVLLMGTLVSLWQARIAREQATLAQHEVKRAQAVQQFLLDLFRANTDAQADPLKAREMTARQLLDIGAARVMRQLQDVPEVQDDVLATLSDMYRAVGLDDKEAEMQRQRVEVRLRMFGPNDPRVAEAIIDLANSLQATNDRQQVPALLARAKAIVDARPDTPEYVRSGLLVERARANMYTAVTRMRDDAQEAAQLMQRPNARRNELATAWNLEARASFWLGQWDTAVRLHEQSIAEGKKHEPEEFGLVLTNTVELADVHAQQAHVAAAEKLYRDILVESIRRNGVNHVDTLHVETRLASFLHATSRRVEARAMRQAVLKKIEQGEGGGTPNLTGVVRRNTASDLFSEGQFDAAARWMGATVDQYRRLHPDSISLASALLTKALVSTEMGRYDDAQKLLDEGESTDRAALGSGAQAVTRNRFSLARARLQITTGHPDRALDSLRAIALPDVSASSVTLDRVRANTLIADANLKLGRTNEAIAYARAAHDEIANSSVRSYYQILEADAELQLGRALLRTGDIAAARSSLERAAALRTANDHVSSPWLAETEIALAECVLALGDITQARVLLSRAAARLAAHKELGEHFTRPLREMRARLATTNRSTDPIAEK